MSIAYTARRGNTINFTVASIVIKTSKSITTYQILYEMVYDSRTDNGRISVLMDFYSTALFIYTEPNKVLKSLFKKLTSLFKSRFNRDFSPGWKKLYHETCGHMNLYVEVLTGTSTGVTRAIQSSTRRSREDMLMSAEIADVGMVDDGNSFFFNATSVKSGVQKNIYLLKNAPLRNFATGKPDIEIKIEL
ncbi:hypothetical protein [Sebaldella sp. S0638]|uniref:hypothetical protein n=1 Tax=Sebaldella sp. S0638 TaxID=2957809 RepID=UPI0020A1F307|nr:hypothetical protein [Sebaldella sp. S0638]MCP1226251.1 hypothetical protein [Sebaldella sp. S0638]